MAPHQRAVQADWYLRGPETWTVLRSNFRRLFGVLISPRDAAACGLEWRARTGTKDYGSRNLAGTGTADLSTASPVLLRRSPMRRMCPMGPRLSHLVRGPLSIESLPSVSYVPSRATPRVAEPGVRSSSRSHLWDWMWRIRNSASSQRNAGTGLTPAAEATATRTKPRHFMRAI